MDWINIHECTRCAQACRRTIGQAGSVLRGETELRDPAQWHGAGFQAACQHFLKQM